MSKGKYASKRGKSSKSLALVLSLVLLITATVGGTLAWLSDKTETVTNTFTSAKLFDDPTRDFTLWEHKAVDENEDGIYELRNEEVKTNSYAILPGVNIPKNPTVDIVDLQENAYLYIKVNNELADGLSCTIDPTYWNALSEEYPDVYVYQGEKAASNVIAASSNSKQTFTVTILTDNQVVVDNNYSGTGDCTLSFEAYMVQAAGNGSNATEAWANTYGVPTP